MSYVEYCKEQVCMGRALTRNEAMLLYEAPLDALCRAADEIRRYFCGERFDLCTIVNGKSGRCAENCKFCAQSSHNHTEAAVYPLYAVDKIVEQAQRSETQGILRFSIVTSGRRLQDNEVDAMCEAIRRVRARTGLAVCASFGLLDEPHYIRLKAAGVTRVHNNLETSRRYFPNICTSHTFDDKITAIRAAQQAGLTVCSGGIMGMGEGVADRIDMALELRALGIRSVPVNVLNPIPGTPLAHQRPLDADTVRRIVAVYRFLLPDASIRLAGGRGLLPEGGRACFQSGANAAITGDMLTTAGITPETDHRMLVNLGYSVALDDAPGGMRR